MQQRNGKQRRGKMCGVCCMFFLFLFTGCQSISGVSSLFLGEPEGWESTRETVEEDTGRSEKEPSDNSSGERDTEQTDTELYVHVCGCVKSPGLYQMREGQRVGDAIAQAGGFSEKANRDAVNLAEILQDGVQIYIPSMQEKDLKETKESSTGEEGERTGTKINLNLATADVLTELSGIGPARAEEIVKYREENGSFSSIDDIKNVPGIGEGIFERIKDLITV